MNFVDRSLGAVVNKLKAKKLYDDTLIVVCSKHGQASIDPTLFSKVNPDNITQAISVDVAWVTV
jgi:arylsulfatase A-like enzyme